MLPKLQYAALLSLTVLSAAQPSLHTRAISDYVCRGEHIRSEAIIAAIEQQNEINKEIEEGKGKGRAPAYPKFFGNKCVGGRCFNVQVELEEFPITTPVWDREKSPGTERVITRKTGGFVGVITKLPGTGDVYEKCQTIGHVEDDAKREAARQEQLKKEAAERAARNREIMEKALAEKEAKEEAARVQAAKNKEAKEKQEQEKKAKEKAQQAAADKAAKGGGSGGGKGGRGGKGGGKGGRGGRRP